MKQVFALAGALLAVSVVVGFPFALFVTKNIDLRFEPFLTLLVAPFLQAVLLLRFVPELRDPRQTFPVMTRDLARLAMTVMLVVAALAILVVTRAVPVSALTGLRAAMLLGAAALFFVSRVRGSLIAAGVLAILGACSGSFGALADLLFSRYPQVLRWIVVFGALAVLVVVFLLLAVERMRPHGAAAFLELSLAPATVAALIVVGGIFWRPWLQPGPLLAAHLLGLAAAALALLGGRAAARGRTLLDLFRDTRDLFLSILVLIVATPLWLLPRRAASRLGRVYGSVARVFWGEGRRTAMINLRRAYGAGMTLEDARGMVREIFGNLGQSLAEGFRRTLPAVRVEDEALCARVLADPRPKIFVTAHLGSWELAVQVVRQRVGGAGIARRVDNRWLHALVLRTRVDDAEQWIEKRGGAGEALQRLRAGQNVMMLLDENGGKRGPFVEFFGRPASTRKTPAVLSLLTGAPIILGAALRDGESFIFRLESIEPLTGSDEIVRTTQRITSTLESWIRDAPTQWRWIHWRWRTRPDGTEERYGSRELRETFGLDEPTTS